MAQFETARMVNQWSQATKAAILSLAIRVDVLAVWQTIPLKGRQNYKELVKRLETQFGHRNMDHVHRTQLKSRHQKPNERLQKFETEVARLVKSAYPTVPDDVCETLAIDKFLDGLRDSGTQQVVKLASPMSLN